MVFLILLGQLAKETYSMAKETYSMAKETYILRVPCLVECMVFLILLGQQAKETYSMANEAYRFAECMVFLIFIERIRICYIQYLIYSIHMNSIYMKRSNKGITQC